MPTERMIKITMTLSADENELEGFDQDRIKAMMVEVIQAFVDSGSVIRAIDSIDVELDQPTLEATEVARRLLKLIGQTPTWMLNRKLELDDRFGVIIAAKTPGGQTT